MERSFPQSYLTSLLTSPLSCSESEKVREVVPQKELNVRYAEGPRALVDLYYPPEGMTPSTPLLVFIHGGYWQALGYPLVLLLTP